MSEKAAQLSRGFELRNWIELLERAGEGVGQTPHAARREFRIFRLEIKPVDFRQQAPWGVEGAVDERVVEDQLCALVGDLRFPPQLHLALQWFKVPLNPVNTDRERVNQVEALGVFGQHRREITAEGHVRADEDPQLSAAKNYEQFAGKKPDEWGFLRFELPIICNLRGAAIEEPPQ